MEGDNVDFGYHIHNDNSNLSMIDDYIKHNSNDKIISGYIPNRNIISVSSSRKVYDAVFGHLDFDNYVWEIIDTVEFQRLRNLKQLGNVHFVYPGGNHTRFEHSLGVANLSSKLIAHLLSGLNKNEYFNISSFNTSIPKISINDDFNIKAVTLAGLLHDLGHGPFSHLFDRKVIKYLDPNCNWEHENGSAMMIEYLIDNNNIEIESDLKKLVKSLILGEIKSSSNIDCHYDSWIYQIVANKKNSIDVDKFDYLRRDSYHVGLNSGDVDFHRIFDSSKIIDNNLCFNIKNDFNLLSLFQTRYKLFKEVYLHRKSIAIDLMVKDALILSNSHFNFLEAIYNPEEYVKLDDGILNTILNFNEYDEDTNHPNLLKASKLVNDISKRKIYRYVGEIIIPKGFEYFINIIKLDDITCCNNPEDEYFIRPEDLDLVFQSFDYGNSDRNPFDSIYFYKYEYPNQSFLSQMKNKSLALPIVFKESMIFLYCKDINKYERAVEIFDSYASKLKKEIEIIKYKKEEKKLYSTPRKNNNDKDKFISNKRGSECCIDDLIKERKNLNFNKIN